MSGDRLLSRHAAALDVARQFGGVDGAHHKAWVIDQMVRVLTGCPTVRRDAVDCNGVAYSYDALGESEEYREYVREACDWEDGPDGPETYEWSEGIAP